MKTHNAQNERIKRAYFTYLTEAKGFSEATLNGVAKALNCMGCEARYSDEKLAEMTQQEVFSDSA
jgi:hypothetical protein